MIKLDKHSNLDYSVINISAFLIKKLTYKGATKYDALLDDVLNEIGERASTNYPYALNFLFLLNKVIYNEKTDTFELK
ncbi:hypothetical protein KO506_11290 [Polaribacter vadi]|uniref:ABC-three component system middle component 8 n=1 Tax=Polaribacter TaxID=52959 RepID=UPI001C0A5E82|nr:MULTISPECIES: ABC-three component system middle component 8 [Polaribacter]MBU3011990.1 hypothetical protein [Polaribacter vadi]MDO6741805.1 hypothetical protein [Polaribacter sp. 1_MG-2023]